MTTPDPKAGPGTSAGYDQLVERLIPGYASLARLAVALLASSPLAGAAAARVLVAGCGTGAELLEARAQRPDWQLTALDPSAAMLAVARSRVPQPEVISWQCSTVEEMAAAECFDGALSVLVLHSLPDDGSKLAFLSALARSLRPGGQLVLVDLMQPERSPLRSQVEEAWLGYQRAGGLETVEGSLQGILEAHHPIGDARLTALVEAAGFSDPAPVFRALDFEGFLLQRRA
ncbi:MAG: class I SAM-dependent methyltransferase [Synechococcaceae cyanobacterium]|nr:class I SAM-dependent methyltransferase [Synechococcaceae cyanobacterium]